MGVLNSLLYIYLAQKYLTLILDTNLNDENVINKAIVLTLYTYQ